MSSILSSDPVCFLPKSVNNSEISIIFLIAFLWKLYYNLICKENLPFKKFFYKLITLINYLYSPRKAVVAPYRGLSLCAWDEVAGIRLSHFCGCEYTIKRSFYVELEMISAKMLDAYRKRNDTLLIDLRSSEEYFRYHIPGARHIDYEDTEALFGLPRNKEIILYCERVPPVWQGQRNGQIRIQCQVNDRRYPCISCRSRSLTACVFMDIIVK